MSFNEEISITAVDKASGPIGDATGALRSMLGQISALAAVGGVGFGLSALVRQGFEFNKVIEDSRGGIAGVLLMTREYTAANGELLTGQRAVTAAMAEADVVQEKLKKDALGTAASYTELVGAFQSAVGPATAAGVESLDSVREITVKATQAMSALGIPMVQAAQELRGLFAGDMGPDNRLNQILRVTKEDLAKVHGNAEATAKLFLDRLSPAASAAAMQTGTLTVRLSNLGDVVDQTMGKATAGLFRDVSSGVADLIAWVEKIGPKAEEAGSAMWTAFKAALGPVQEIARLTFAAVDSRVKESGGTWTEVLQGFAVVVNNVAYFIRTGWAAMFEALVHPLDMLRTLFGSTMRSILLMVADVAEKVPAALGGGAGLAEQIRAAADAVDEWGSKDNKWLAETAASQDRALEAWRANEAAILAIGAATRKVSDDPRSNPKDLAAGGAAAAYHFGTVWAAESAKATAAFQKFLGGFASFTGDRVGEAVAKIEAEYEGLVGQLGQMIFQAKVPFEKGLAMLEELARAKGQKIAAAVFNGEAAVEEFISVLEAKLTRDDLFAGIKEGWRAVAEAIPSTAASAANAVRDVWAGMTRSFDDLFFNVLSGRLSSLKDVFKNLWQSLLQTFSRFLSDMVQRWVKSQLEMKLAAYSEQGEGFVGPPRSAAPGGGKSGGGWGSVLGYVGAGMTGYGIGGSIGAGGIGNQVGGAVGAVGGLLAGTAVTAALTAAGTIAAGAAIGSAIPVLGTIVGALIGAIIGGLFNKSTERSVDGSLGAMAGATRWDYIPGYTRVNRRTGEEEEIPGRWEGYTERPKTAFERQGQKILESQTAGLADLFRAGAKDQARDLVRAYQAALKESLSGANFKISAGSTEDIEKDAEYLLTKLLPRIGLSAAFGQKGYLPPGFRDLPGGIPGINYGMPGMNPDGTWMEKQLFDPEAPIPKLLAGLGFTAEKIGELAGRVSTDDPQKLLAYLQGIVGVVVGLRDLGVEMGKSFATLTKEWSDEAAAGPTAAFGKRAQELAEQLANLSLYSGDEQVQKAQEALAASSEFWEGVKSYLAELNAMGEKLSASLQGMREKMRAFLNPLSEGDSVAADWTNVEGVWGRLFASMTPAEIERAANEAAASIERTFTVMAERITRGNALLERTWALFGKLGDLGKDITFDQLLRDNPLRAYEKQLVDMQGRLAKAATLSGLEQIAALEDVNASAEEMYGNLKSFLSDIASVSASINKSIDSQIWELGVGELDAAGQADAVGERIRQLQEQLRVATSPAEVQAIVSEIQALTSRYVGQFGPDDENRAEAIAWAQEQLERARGLANESLEALRKAAEEQAAELQGILKGAADLLAANVAEASGVIGQLSHTLGELDKAVQEALGRLGQAALDSLGPLRTAFEEASGIFTSAVGDSAFSLTGPEGFNAGLSTSTEALGGFEAAVRRAGNALKQIGYGPEDGTEKTTQAAPKVQRVSSAQITATIRRSRAFLTPRVA